MGGHDVAWKRLRELGLPEERLSKLALPPERDGWVSKLSVAGHEVYVIVSEHEGEPVEMFLVYGKEGGTVHGLLDALAISLSSARTSAPPLTTSSPPT